MDCAVYISFSHVIFMSLTERHTDIYSVRVYICMWNILYVSMKGIL